MTSTLDRPIAAPTRAALDIDRLGPGFGAEVRGVDLSTADDETVAAVRQALTEHKVLFFTGQRLDPDSQVALGNRMGRLTVSHPLSPASTRPTRRSTHSTVRTTGSPTSGTPTSRSCGARRWARSCAR